MKFLKMYNIFFVLLMALLVIIEVNYLVFDIMAMEWLVILEVIGSFLDNQLVDHFHYIQDHQEIFYWPRH